jgi:transposase
VISVVRRNEEVLHGSCEAFDFFAAAPKELWWDNSTTVAIHISRGRTLNATEY